MLFRERLPDTELRTHYTYTTSKINKSHKSASRVTSVTGGSRRVASSSPTTMTTKNKKRQKKTPVRPAPVKYTFYATSAAVAPPPIRPVKKYTKRPKIKKYDHQNKSTMIAKSIKTNK